MLFRSPGEGGHKKFFAVEVVAYLNLPAGDTTLGMNVGIDRTDVNDDDGYIVTSGATAGSFFNGQIGAFSRTGDGFNDRHNNNEFVVTAPSDGVYPIRIVYWQTDHGANLNFYSVDAETGDKILVNDVANDGRALLAFRTTANAKANAAYVAEVSPFPDSSGVSSSESIVALVSNGASALKSYAMFLNGTKVTPQSVSKTGSKTKIKYDP